MAPYDKGKGKKKKMGPAIPIGGGFYSVPPNPAYIKMLERRKEAISNLCDAAKAYLLVDIEIQLDSANEPMSIPVNPHYTPEHLVELQAKREKVQEKIDAVEKMLNEIPEHLAGYFESVMIPLFEEEIQRLDNQIQSIQTHLDGINPGVPGVE